MEGFLVAYKPHMGRFIRAVERAEARLTGAGRHRQQLSFLMRQSWSTKRFWFDFAVRKHLDIDDLFYAFFNKADSGIDFPNDIELEGLDLFVSVEMHQLAEYKKDTAPTQWSPGEHT